MMPALSSRVSSTTMKFLVVLGIIVTSSAAEVSQLLTDDFIESINQKQSAWVAGRNFPEDTQLEKLRRLAGTILEPVKAFRETKVHPRSSISIPETFDAREEWPFCESIRTIRYQGGCGSCWAFAAVEVMSDRLCIGSKGKVKFEFSPEDVIECCQFCGSCSGGAAPEVFDFWVKEGVASGGDFSSNKGCKPYQLDDPSVGDGKPQCSKSCSNDNYKTFYMNDKHFGTSSYYVSKEVEQIQREIMTNGPVAASFIVYDDFYSYQSGVYLYTTGNETGGHSIKIIGWGVENDIPYWLIANSWGEEWGGLNGFFKYLRGKNHCYIENSVSTGLPRLW